MKRLEDKAGIIFSCPYEVDDSTCPFKNIREMKPAERVQAIKNLSDDEIFKMVHHHDNCSRKT